MPTVLGLLYVVLAIFLLCRRGYHWALSLAVAAPVGVIATVAGNGIPIFYFLGLFAMLAAVVHAMKHKTPPRSSPGGSLLLVFLAWAVAVTAVAPMIFEGIDVLAPRGGIDNQLADPSALAFTASNVAQAGYLGVGVGVVFFLGRMRTLNHGFLGVGLGLVTVICFARLVAVNTGLPFPAHFFDNSETVSFIESFATGQKRFRGIFAEPSELSTSAIVSMVYFAFRLKFLTPGRRVWALVLIGMAAANMWFSTSATALAAGLAFMAVAIGAGVHSFVARGGRIPVVGAVGAVLVFAGVVLAAPSFMPALMRTIEDKAGSQSYETRTGADEFSFGVLADTLGFGAGLGSNRPSTFLPMLLSSVGVVGMLLFICAAVVLARRAWAVPEARPVVWAFLALMVTKSVAGPNLSEPLIWLCLGVFAQVAWNACPPREVIEKQRPKVIAISGLRTPLPAR